MVKTQNSDTHFGSLMIWFSNNQLPNGFAEITPLHFLSPPAIFASTFPLITIMSALPLVVLFSDGRTDEERNHHHPYALNIN